MTTTAATAPQLKTTKSSPRRGRPVKKVSTVLVNAKAIAEECGLTKGCLRRTNGRVCMEGALAIACGKNPEDITGGFAIISDEWGDDMQGGRSLFEAAEDCIQRAVGRGPIAVNDGTPPRQRKRSVFAAFDKAITLAKKDERAARSSALVNA